MRFQVITMTYLCRKPFQVFKTTARFVSEYLQKYLVEFEDGRTLGAPQRPPRVTSPSSRTIFLAFSKPSCIAIRMPRACAQTEYLDDHEFQRTSTASRVISPSSRTIFSVFSKPSYIPFGCPMHALRQGIW